MTLNPLVEDANTVEAWLRANGFERCANAVKGVTEGSEAKAPEQVGQPVRVDLVGCARCQGPGHDGLVFYPLTHAVEFDPEQMQDDLTHWAPCPTNGQPILMSIRGTLAPVSSLELREPGVFYGTALTDCPDLKEVGKLASLMDGSSMNGGKPIRGIHPNIARAAEFLRFFDGLIGEGPWIRVGQPGGPPFENGWTNVTAEACPGCGFTGPYDGHVCEEHWEKCPACGGDPTNNWFDRTICACSAMHTRCSNCGAALDGCPHEKKTPE